jgi:hypothetical protein
MVSWIWVDTTFPFLFVNEESFFEEREITRHMGKSKCYNLLHGKTNK